MNDVFFPNNKASSPPRKCRGGGGPRSPQAVSPRVRFTVPPKTRTSPSKDRSPRSSPSHSDYYAGFSEPPAPTALPQPPSHWIPPQIQLRSCGSSYGGIGHQGLSCYLQEFNLPVQVGA